ncbi:hypothetical protein [Seongchinamella sediminis]|uniref:hypothetical protein n=1 Tax=Seongchinamella sediminis TaxID=2283635 RepID=UPI0010588353|nr:hypothetical protein [Seongchinamella sediminis]
MDWFPQAEEFIFSRLDISKPVQGFDVLLEYLSEYTPEGLEGPNTEYGIEELEGYTRQHIDEFTVWLLENSNRIYIDDGSFLPREAEEEKSEKELENRASELACLSLENGPPRRLRKVEVLVSEITGIIEAGSSERIWANCFSLGIGAFITSLTSMFSLEDPPIFVVVFLTASVAATIISAFAWLAAHMKTKELQSQILNGEKANFNSLTLTLALAFTITLGTSVLLLIKLYRQ